MGIPLPIEVQKLSDYFEVMCKAVFQAGLSWASIDKRWSAFRLAFKEFDPAIVSKLSEKERGEILSNRSLLINEKKLDATIYNAGVLLRLDEEFNSFADYLRSFKSYDGLAADLKKHFKYIGDMNVYYFLFRVGEPVLDFDKWIKAIKGDHPRMVEMIDAAREKNKSKFGDAINLHRKQLAKKTDN